MNKLERALAGAKATFYDYPVVRVIHIPEISPKDYENILIVYQKENFLQSKWYTSGKFEEDSAISVDPLTEVKKNYSYPDKETDSNKKLLLR